MLLVEDEASVALLIESMLEDLGCELAGSAAHLAKALDLARQAAADVAVLDINLGGQRVFPVCEVLGQRGIPFVFSSGYGVDGLPPEQREHPVLKKPFSDADLQRALVTALSSQRGK
ncbi:response regulator [Rhodoligotrophos defluvii]|uniref:response regulator n=1 Tax=Rhodoligotrophos defluvii TaxID=2561934 RepID=UPI001EF127A8|nr:response regulator [Rhodoligotrophos defluvii]